MPQLYCGDLSPGQLVEFVSLAKWPEDALLLAFTPATWTFEQRPAEGKILPDTVEGRIFSPEGEFRWRRIDDHYRAIYLGHGPPPPLLEDSSAHLAGLQRVEEQFLLWGERSDLENEWLEQQIPQRFAYPLEGKDFPRGRVTLIVEHWMDEGGSARFSRYHSIKEVSGECHAAR